MRAAVERAGRPIGLLFDLQGPKLRLSAAAVPCRVRAGEVVTFTSTEKDVGERRVPVDFADFPRLVTDRSEIVIGDGVPRLVVESVGPGEVVATTYTDFGVQRFHQLWVRATGQTVPEAAS